MDLNQRAAGLAMLIGMLLVTVGAGGYDWRLGCIVGGVVFLLSIKSLWQWIK